jgi:trans-AT polyketide synthase/acyltransferase/oxidoreductase domain-containing protein
MSIACLFPGQGSQSKGMGAALFDRFPDWTSEADALLGYSIRDLCVDDPRGELGRTAFTQPALFVVNALTYRAREESGAKPPAFVAGHSLGEYNALLSAGVFDFATGLSLVRERGTIMGQASGGGMTAVIGLPPAAIEDVLSRTEEGQRVDVANFNSPEQTVLAGERGDLAALEPALKAAGARTCIALKVGAAFHSRYMLEPMRRFSALLESVRFERPAIPVVSNLTGRPYGLEDMRGTLAGQIGHSVRWLDSMLFLMAEGVTDFEEVGPGSVLTKLAAQIRKSRGPAHDDRQTGGRA